MANSFYEHSGYPPGSRARNSSQKLRDEFLAVEAGAQAIEAALALKADAADVSEVDNTSDADKPISRLTQAALDLKADYSALVDFNPATAGADKMLVTNATGDGWEYPAITAAGKALLDDASAAAQRETLGIGGNIGKNLLINGGFDVWQRGTSFTPSAFGIPTYTADNLLYGTCITATVTVSRQALTQGSTGGLFTAKYFSRTVVDGINIGTQHFRQRIEGLHQFSGRTITLSFYAKSSPELAGGKSVALNMLYDATNSNPTMHYVYHSSSSGLGTTNSWQRYTRTFDVPAATHEALTEHSCLEVIFTLSTYNGTYTFDIANVQLEFGDTATDFEYRHPAEELALCQRYYEKGTIRGPFAQYLTNFAVGPQVPFLVEKRKTPLVTLGELSTEGNDGTPGALYAANENTRGINPVYNWTGGTVGRSFYGQATWTADAGL